MRNPIDSLFGRLALLVLIVLVSVWVGTRIANATSDTAAFTEHTYIVQKGDTLWGIAKASYAQSGDLRQVVYLIERRNGLAGGDIRPGQRLTLPLLAR